MYAPREPHRSRHSDARPHTVHSSSAAFVVDDHETSDGEITPRASACDDARIAYPDLLRQRLSRDDTTADVHVLASPASSVPTSRSQDFLISSSAPRMPASADTAMLVPSLEGPTNPSEETHLEHLRALRRPRRNPSRYPSQPSAASSSTSLLASAMSVDVADLAPGETKTASLGRRFSRHYKERVLELRESMQKYALPVVSSRNRRLSQPPRMELVHEAGGDIVLDTTTTPHAPTSPSKRCARQVDDRPRKHRTGLFPLGDRKDTPAPPAFGLPVRTASTVRHQPSIVAAPAGGDGARKAAAFHNSSNFPHHATAPMPSAVWSALDRFVGDADDIHTRRHRLGSLSSAADSGADLSTYSGSDTSARDGDGDVDMDHDVPVASPITRDFVKLFPHELSLSIFQLLDAPDLLRAESVSRSWHSLAQDMQVWRAVFLRKYQRRILTDPPPIQVGGIGVGRLHRPNQEWRKMYKARRQLDENWRAGAADAGKAIYLSGHTDSVYCLQFDEEKIITGSRDRTIRVWDINTFQCLRVIGGPNVKPALGPKVLRTVDYPSFHMATASVNGTAYGDGIFHVPSQWHDASILCLQYDSQILVTGSSDSDLLVWDIATYEPIRRLRRHVGGVLDVALDARHIVSCSKDSKIIVWDRQTFEAKGELTGHRGPVNAVQLRGHLLVSASGDGIARLWDLNQMRLIKEFSAKERGLAAVEFSEDMKYVLAGGNDNITYKFETETGQEVMQFTGHSQLVRSLWLDSANNRVVSGSYDLDLRVYDFESGRELWRGEEWTTSWMLAAKSDYRRIVATSQDGRILIVDFGILKGAPVYKSRDGMPIENIDLLRGIEHTNAIQFRNPFEPSSSSSTSFSSSFATTSSSSVLASPTAAVTNAPLPLAAATAATSARPRPIY